MRMFEGVIFDLDGTLLDSLEDIANAANEVLRELGKDALPIDRFRVLVGDGVGVLMERILPNAANDPEFRLECMHRFERHYQLHWNKRSKPYDGIDNLLNSLVQSGMALAVLSNKPDAFTKKCVEHFFPQVPFCSVLGQSDRFPKKPDPTGGLWIASHMGFAIDRIAYVGDTNTDMKTAVGAGFFAIGVAWGFRTRQELESSGARVVYSDPSALLAGLLQR
jgi:phosphoglycolate phosphatase